MVTATVLLLQPRAIPPYQPPAAPHQTPSLTSPNCNRDPTSSQLRHTLLPVQLQARLIADDLMDILHANEVDSGKEQPISLEVGKGHQLTLSHKWKHRDILDFSTWSQCFLVYNRVLTSVQPACGSDLFAYHYIIATVAREYSSNAFLGNGIAFRKRAAQYQITHLGGD